MSWSPRWLSWAPLGASWAGLGDKRAPKMAPKVLQNGSLNWLKDGPEMYQFLDPLWDSFGGQNMAVRGTHFSRFFGWLGTDMIINSIISWAPDWSQMYLFFMGELRVMFKSICFSLAKWSIEQVLAHLGVLMAPSCPHLHTMGAPEGSIKQES